MKGMNKTPADLDMAAIIDSAITKYLDDRKLTGAVPFEKMTAVEKVHIRQAFAPVIASALPAILEQLNAKQIAAEETEEEILSGFEVPDTLEGLLH